MVCGLLDGREGELDGRDLLVECEREGFDLLDECEGFDLLDECDRDGFDAEDLDPPPRDPPPPPPPPRLIPRAIIGSTVSENIKIPTTTGTIRNIVFIITID